MRTATVFLHELAAGHLAETPQGFSFAYTETYLQNTNNQAISLTIPLSEKVFESPVLFPFFFNQLVEGYNKSVLCRLLKIDENDYFGLLLATAHTDTIGAVRIVENTTITQNAT